MLPRADAFADRALALQNAVIRHCYANKPATRRQLERTFRAATVDVALLLPVTFGAPEAEALPVRLLTEAADTAFSRSRLAAIVSGRAEAPRTVAALREEEAALTGLPALEAVMLATSTTDLDTHGARCTVALTVAAHVRSVALGVRRVWARGDVARHWLGDAPDLADRLRLRDLIQGMIDTVVALNRDLDAYVLRSARNPGLPFSDPRTMTAFLDAAAAALSRQARLLVELSDEGEPAVELLNGIVGAIEEGRLALREGTGPVSPARIRLPFRAAQSAIVGRLPGAFGFDASAFERPPGAIGGAPSAG